MNKKEELERKIAKLETKVQELKKDNNELKQKWEELADMYDERVEEAVKNKAYEFDGFIDPANLATEAKKQGYKTAAELKAAVQAESEKYKDFINPTDPAALTRNKLKTEQELKDAVQAKANEFNNWIAPTEFANHAKNRGYKTAEELQTAIQAERDKYNGFIDPANPNHLMNAGLKTQTELDNAVQAKEDEKDVEITSLENQRDTAIRERDARANITPTGLTNLETERDTYRNRLTTINNDLMLAKTDTINRIEIARAAGSAISHIDLKIQLNRDGETIADQDVDTADSWHTWINNATVAQLAEREGKALKVIELVNHDLTIATAMNNAEVRLNTLVQTIVPGADESVRNEALKIWLTNNGVAFVDPADTWKAYLRRATTAEELSIHSVKITEGAKILEASLTIDLTVALGVIEAFRANQGVEHINLNNQLRNDYHIAESTWQDYLNNSPPANLGNRKLNILNSLVQLIISQHYTRQEHQIVQQLNTSLKLGLGAKADLNETILVIERLINKPKETPTFFGEKLEDIKDIDSKFLKNQLSIQLATEVMKQMTEATNYQQFAEVRNLEIGKNFARNLNSLQSVTKEKEMLLTQQRRGRIVLIILVFALLLSLLAVGGLIVYIYKKRKKLTKINKRVKRIYYL